MTIPRPKPTTIPQMLTVAQVAAILNLSQRQVRRLIAGGDLNVHRFGRAVRISETEVKAYIGTHS